MTHQNIKTSEQNKVDWLTDKKISIGPYHIPYAQNLHEQVNHKPGVRKESKSKLALKRVLWPLVKFRNDLLVDGFIERAMGKWIKKLATEDSTCLEVGCGNMSLQRFLHKHMWYNAFDFSFSEFQLLRVLKKKNKINIAIASATNIPLESNTVSLIFSKEVFEHIPQIDLAIDEIHRVAKPNAKLICSIPNNYCHKYKKKGAHPQHINNWTYDEFIKFMASHNFKLLEGYMKGFWIPLARGLNSTSYQLPLSSSKEYYNTNFIFLFEALDPSEMNDR